MEGISSGGNRFFEAFLWALAVAVSVPFLAFAFPGLVGAEEALIVRSGSMEPAIQTGSVVWVEPEDSATITEGDIITYRSGTSGDGTRIYTTHRVVEVTEEGGERRFRTKGDANQNPDRGSVAAGDVLGTVMFTVPQMGYLMVWLGQRNIILVLVGVPAALLILLELRAVFRELRGVETEEEVKQSTLDEERYAEQEIESFEADEPGQQTLERSEGGHGNGTAQKLALAVSAGIAAMVLTYLVGFVPGFMEALEMDISPYTALGVVAVGLMMAAVLVIELISWTRLGD